MKVYVYDILIKSWTVNSFIDDLNEAFVVLQDSRKWHNPKKYIFGVQSGKVLGYTISSQGIEANPDKVRVIQDMAFIRSVKDVQRLINKLTALNQFLSKYAQHGLPFFKALKMVDKFEWDSECQEVFEKLKE